VTAVDVDALDAARAAATPGPWSIDAKGWIDAGDYATVIGPADVDCMSYCYGGTSRIEGDNLPADAALIVAAVNALPELLAEVRRGRALREALEGLAKELDQELADRGILLDRVIRPGDRLRAALAAVDGGERS
jgi:hypothetical protein